MKTVTLKFVVSDDVAYGVKTFLTSGEIGNAASYLNSSCAESDYDITDFEVAEKKAVDTPPPIKDESEEIRKNTDEEKFVYMTKCDLEEFAENLIMEARSETIEAIQKMKEDEILYTKKGFAKRCGVTTTTLQNWCKQGLLTGTKVGGQVLYKGSDLKMAIVKNLHWENSEDASVE